MTFVKNLTYTQVAHILGLAAIAVLVGIGVVPLNIGLPLLTGVVGLGINIESSAVNVPIVKPKAAVSTTTTTTGGS